MDARMDLDDLDVVIRRRNGRYLAKIPQIGLYATEDSLSKVVAALEAKKQSLKEELIKADALDEIGIAVARRTEPVGTISGLIVFAAKAIIVLAVVLYAASSVERHFDKQVTQLKDQLQAMTRMGGASFWTRVEKEIGRVAGPAGDLPPAKKQEMLANLRVIVERWRPFMSEAQLLFSGNNDSPTGNK